MASFGKMNVVIVLVLSLLVSLSSAVVSDSELFQSLNLNWPGLSEVKQLFDQNNITGAKLALTQYYKTRTNPKWYYDPLHPNKSQVTIDIPDSNAIVDGEICVVSVCYRFPNGSSFDWAFNPTYNNPHMAYDPEWQWQLGRMPWWSTLGATWWGTNTTAYAQTWVNQMINWIDTCPMPSVMNNSDWSSWRTIECGIRMSTSWPDAYNRFLTAPEFNSDSLILLLKSFLDHGNYLYKFHTSGNWLTMEMNGLFTVGALFPEFSNASNWRIFAAQTLHEGAQEDFLPDGMWNELTTGYMQVSIENLQALYTVSVITGTSNDVPNDFIAILQNAYDCNVKMMCPIGDLPYVNDAWEVGVAGVSQQALPYFPNDPLIIWSASNRVKGSPPPFTSVHLNSSNYIIMRSGWGFNDTYALFDAAPLGARHYHQDKLNLIVDAFGRRLMYDGGGGPYEVSKFRDFAIDTPSHNTIIVDGQPQRRAAPSATDPMGSGNPKTPAPVFTTNSATDYAVGYYMDPYGSAPICTHMREVVFNKENPQFFIVADTLSPYDTKEHTYQANWNLLTTHYYVDSSLTFVATNDTGKPNMAVIPLILTNTSTQNYVAVNTSTELWGWDVDRNPPFQIPALEIAHIHVGSGVQQMATFLLPLQTNQEPNIKSIDRNTQSNEYTIYFTNGSNVYISLLSGGGVKYIVNNGDLSVAASLTP